MRVFLSCLLLIIRGAAAVAQTAAPSTPADTAKIIKKAVPDDPAPVHEYGGTGTVMRRDNTDIYVMSRPSRPYEVTGRIVNNSMAAETDPLSGNIIIRGQTIVEQIDNLLVQARERQKRYDFPYDALLTFDGQVGTFVRWKNRKPSQAATPSEVRKERE